MSDLKSFQIPPEFCRELLASFAPPVEEQERFQKIAQQLLVSLTPSPEVQRRCQELNRQIDGIFSCSRDRLLKIVEFQKTAERWIKEYGEGTPWGDLFTIYKDIQDEREINEAALNRTLARLGRGVKDPRAKKVLAKLSRKERAELLSKLFMAGLLLALGNTEEPRKIRIGRKYVRRATSKNGKVPLVPPGHLNAPTFVRWIFQEAYKSATNDLKDTPTTEMKSATTDDLPELYGFSIIKNERELKELAPFFESKAQPIDELLIERIEQGDAANLENLAEILKASLSKQQLNIFELAATGMSSAAIAERLQRDPDTVRQHMHRIKKKARQIKHKT